MNIHEHQAKKILKNYGAKVPKGIFAFTVQDLLEKAKTLETEKYVLKAQIHSGGRGKAGGIKLVNNLDELEKEAKNLIGKILVTHQTGPNGRKVNRLYVEESSAINKEFYLSCLVDRESSKIAFISSDQGGMDIEEVANKNPEKILTTKVEFSDQISEDDCKKIIEIFNLDQEAKEETIKLIKSIYKMFIETDASLVEINPLILTKDNNKIEDNMIVELSYDTDDSKEDLLRWIPYRIRYDKTELYRITNKISGTANDYSTAQNVWNTIQNQITNEMIMGEEKVTEELVNKSKSENEVYYNRETSREQSLLKPLLGFHNYWVKNQFLYRRFTGANSLFEIACGKGGDLHKWAKSRYKLVVGSDINEDNLYNVTDGIYKRYNQLVKKNVIN